MQGMQPVRAIFCYAFRVLAPGPRQDSGFAVNVFDNDTLQYTEYKPGGAEARQETFMLQPGTRMRLMEIIGCGSVWLGAVPPRMGTGSAPMTEARIGFAGYPVRIVQDLPLLITAPFRSQTGHNARILYNLLEDVASILFESGFVLLPDGFTWQAQIKPISPRSAGGTKKHRRVSMRG